MLERLEVREPGTTTAQVAELGTLAVTQMNDLHARAHAAGWPQDPRASATLRTAFDDVQRRLSSAPSAQPGRLKRTLLGPYFRWTSVDGMVNPFALEVLANPDLLPFEIPFVAAHEWAHLAGYAHEAEANFVGWLSCVRADPVLWREVLAYVVLLHAHENSLHSVWALLDELSDIVKRIEISNDPAFGTTGTKMTNRPHVHPNTTRPFRTRLGSHPRRMSRSPNRPPAGCSRA